MTLSDFEHHRCLYNLDKDEFEKENSYYDEKYKDIKERLSNSFYKWLVFDAIAPTHLNEKACTLANRLKTAPEEKDRERMNKYIIKYTNYDIF